MKMILGLCLAALIAATAAACGGDSHKKDAAASTPTGSATPHGVASIPDDENKVVYHDATAQNDVTVKTFRKVVEQMPKAMTCQDLLTGGKALGNTYPNGEDFYLRKCNEVPRK